jgi:hypothetical protein
MLKYIIDLFRPDWITSSSGEYSILIGRDQLIYREHSRKMAITIDSDTDSVIIFVDTVGRWNDNLSNSVDDGEKHRIIRNLCSLLDSRGYRVRLV